ncbi:MAG: hypothetical protein EOP06_23185, partial [Proteobacteria bacterium]
MRENQGYYSQPTIHNNTVVFVSDDDLWKVSVDGGEATRLTANVGVASQPRLSPDGTKIAYLGNDQGAPALYLISSSGGQPKQLIPFPISNLIGWK